MEEYKSNSHRSREIQKGMEPEKRADKIVTGEVTIKKKNEIQKFAGEFIAEDLRTIGSHIWNDIVVPNVKDTFFDMVTRGLSMLMFGDRDRGGKKPKAFKSSYTDYYKSDRDRQVVEETRARSRFDYDDIVIRNRGDAEHVLYEMEDYIDRYKYVTVLDLYDMLGRTAPFTAERYGWTDISNARLRHVRDGYKLDLPRPMPLD